MVLVSPSPSNLQDISDSRLDKALKDMVNNIAIEPQFRITHPQYHPFELPEEAVARFEVMPEALQYKYLGLQLRSFLYGIYYNGSLQSALKRTDDTLTQPIPAHLENTTQLGVNLSFYEKLHEANHGHGYFDPGWLILKEESDGALAVRKGDLTLHIQRSHHLTPQNQSASPGDIVAIQLPRNMVQNGFYMAVGDRGPQSHRQGVEEAIEPVVRIYFNVTPEGAVTCMAQITQQLNQQEIPFSFKALYNPEDYERYDAGVLYFSRSHYPTIYPILKQLYVNHQALFRYDVPLFTKPLAPGLGLAEEPDFKFVAQESFGMNRCQLVANGLLNAHLEGRHSPEQRWDAIAAQFDSLGVKMEQPYLNATTEDCYPIL